MVEFLDGTELHLREYVNLEFVEPRLMYAYHYQSREKQLIFRYDNARHNKPTLPFREHLHTSEGVVYAPPPPLNDVLVKILEQLAV